MRDNDFSQTTKDAIGKSAMYVCSNPDCLKFTGYAEEKGRPRAIAEAAHVLPNGKKGPRSNEMPEFADIELWSAANGIWLCTTCHPKVDNAPSWYPAQMLFDWKKGHEDIIRRLAGLDLEAALLELREHKRYHHETRELLSFLDDRRALYEGMDYEFPPRVLQSVTLMRERVIRTRAMVSADSKVAIALEGMQTVINTFLREIGHRVDLDVLACDSADPVWLRFKKQVEDFRTAMRIIIAHLADGSGYIVKHVY